MFLCSSGLVDGGAGGTALAVPDVAETTLDAIAGAAVDVVGCSLLSAEAVASWSSSVSSERSESERAGPMASLSEVVDLLLDVAV